jgi:hypothetical protein
MRLSPVGRAFGQERMFGLQAHDRPIVPTSPAAANYVAAGGAQAGTRTAKADPAPNSLVTAMVPPNITHSF